MGCCSSKTNPSSIPSPQQTQNPHPQNEPRIQTNGSKLCTEIANKEGGKESAEKLGLKKKEVFVIQHRRSHDKRSDSKASSSESDGSIQPANSPEPESSNTKTPASESAATNVMAMATNGAAVRTSSCTKEEVDAILIQCGRLSRSSSGNVPFSGSARKYSGSKRSHDFDRENEIPADLNCANNGDIDDEDDDGRQTRRQSRGSHRRRTPSRSRERDPQSQKSASSSGSRRVSRSPGRRSKSPVTKSGNLGASANTSGSSTTTSNSNGGIRPGKMVSVPATVSIEKNSNNGDGNVKRVLVKRNLGESRGATPPRSRSPASRSNVVDASGVKEVMSLSRSNSRKAENSPYRRTPLNEVEMNSLPFQPLANRAIPVTGQQKSSEIEEVGVKQPSQDKLGVDMNNAKIAVQGGAKDMAQINYCRVNEIQPQMRFEQYSEDTGEHYKATGYDAAVKLPLTLTRSRSSRRSRDLDINVEALMDPNPATNYNLLLLQDIKNFHQKTNSTSASDTNPNSKTPLSLPECLSKANSIVEAVADLNSSTKPNHSSTSVDGKKRVEKSKVPFMESEVNGEDDNVTEPRMHQYVTVRKRGSGVESFQGGDFDELESSGSNSYTSGSRNHCVSSSSWEPNSIDSTDRWRSRSKEGVRPVTLDRHAFSSNRGREL